MPSKKASDLEILLSKAMKACFEYARQNRFVDIDDIAAETGVKRWTLYKWIETGYMPAHLVAPYEKACGLRAMTDAICTASGCVAVPLDQATTPKVHIAKVQIDLAKAMLAIAQAETQKQPVINIDDVNSAIKGLIALRNQFMAEGKA